MQDAASAAKLEPEPSKPRVGGSTPSERAEEFSGFIAPPPRLVGVGGSPVGAVRRARGPDGARDAGFLAYVRANDPADVRTLFMARVRRGAGKLGCLEWCDARGRNYGGSSTLCYDDGVRKGHLFAHRAAWLLFVGPIDPQYPAMRHLCHRSQQCVNWLHLEPGTDSENRLDCAYRPKMAPRLRPLPEGLPMEPILNGNEVRRRLSLSFQGPIRMRALLLALDEHHEPAP